MPKKRRKTGPKNRRIKDMYVDANGCPTEVVAFGNQKVVVHYEDIPESDITTVNGLRCTTALRTVIDLATTTPEPDLMRMIRDCLDRELFTVDEALTRLAQPDMAARRGAHILRPLLPQ